MKRQILIGAVFLMIGLINVAATYYCGDGQCEADYCPSDCVVFLSSYCEGLIEPYECDDICGSELGWIRPPDCTDYGYYLECDSCCADCGTTGLPSRSEVTDFCEGYGFIQPSECPADDCSGLINPSECPSYGYTDTDYCLASCPECGDEGYERCDSCCPKYAAYQKTGEDDDDGFPWWLLLIGFGVGYYFKNNKGKKLFGRR